MGILISLFAIVMFFTILNKNSKSRHLPLVPDLTGNAFTFSPFNDIDCCFVKGGFINLRHVCSVPNLWWVFIMKNAESFQMIFCIYWDDNVDFFPFILLIGFMIFINLQMFYLPYIPGLKKKTLDFYVWSFYYTLESRLLVFVEFLHVYSSKISIYSFFVLHLYLVFVSE